MLTPEQINNIHRLHWVEKWSVRKIARQLHLGRRTIAKYLTTPAPPPVHRDRSSKLDSFKPAIAELLEQDATISAALIEQRLRAQDFEGGMTIVKDYVRTLRKSTAARLSATTDARRRYSANTLIYTIFARQSKTTLLFPSTTKCGS